MKSDFDKKLKELPDLLTISQAAELLNVHIDTLRNWEKRGILIPIRIGARRDRRYNKEKIIKIIK